MRIITRTIQHPSTSDRISLYPLGDVHIGAAGCQEALFQQKIEQIRSDPHARWIGMGDYCDLITRKDPRFAIGGLADWIKVPDLADIARAQRDRFVSLVKPIADQCLCLLSGNHETGILKHNERNVYLEIAKDVLNAMTDPPDSLVMGYAGFLRIRLERGRTAKSKGHHATYDLFCHHGYGGGRLAGHKALKLERAAQRYQADLVLVGHWHTMQTVPVTIVGIGRRGTRLFQHTRKAVSTGHWLDSHALNHESYAEVAGYPPSAPGCPTITLIPSNETLTVTL